MKKLFSALFALVMVCTVFTACSKSETQTTTEISPDTYIGEGMRTAFAGLVDSNQTFYNEVFVLGHLKINEKEKFTKDGKTYAPVNDDRFASYDALVQSLNATYTEDCVKKILKTYNYYKDIDGVFCFDTSFKASSGNKWVRRTDAEVETEEIGEDYYVLEYTFDCGKKDEMDEFRFVKINNTEYRLEELQYVD